MKYCNAQNALCKYLLILRAWNATRLLKPGGKGYNSDHPVLIRFPIKHRSTFKRSALLS